MFDKKRIWIWALYIISEERSHLSSLPNFWMPFSGHLLYASLCERKSMEQTVYISQELSYLSLDGCLRPQWSVHKAHDCFCSLLKALLLLQIPKIVNTSRVCNFRIKELLRMAFQGMKIELGCIAWEICRCCLGTGYSMKQWRNK